MLVMVDTDDAQLIARRDAAQEVKSVHRAFRQAGVRTTHCIARFKISRIEVKPGGRLSLQMHRSHAEQCRFFGHGQRP
jgi:mannose-1-phosphate guanylyltransferase / mannose-6-phosphate isomerase